MTTVLLTRPLEDSRRLASELASRGIATVVAPLIEIAPRDDATLDLDGVGAVLLTSANGARALAHLTPRRDLRVLAVGSATAGAAKELGFADPESADGDVADLARLASERLRPDAGDLLHVAGSDVAGDLAGLLEAKGFRVRRTVAYDARPVAALPEPAVDALRNGRINAVALFSPRTGAAFATLVRAAGLEKHLGSVEALCLSAAVANEVQGLAWRAVRTAAKPDQAAWLALVPEPSGGETSVDERPPPAATVAPPSVSRGRTWPTRLALVGLIAAVLAGGWVAYGRLHTLGARLDAVESDVAGLATAPAEPAVASAEVDALAGRLADLAAAVQALRAAPPPGPDPDLVARLDTLERRLADLGAGLDAVSAVPAAADAGTEGRIAALEAAIGAGVARSDVARLDRRADDLASGIGLLHDVIDAVTTRVAALETGNRARPLMALVVAVGQLRDSLRGAAPFGPALAAVRELAAQAEVALPDLDRLEPLAASGVAAPADLEKRFAAVVAAVLQPATPVDAPWTQRVLDRLSGLLTVRRVGGDVPGDGAEARLARAEVLLATGDLAGAVAEVAAIGAADPVTSVWLADAAARLDADAAVAALGERVIAAVAAATP